MATVTVAILGLGRMGASIGLALKRYGERKDAAHTFDIIYADLRGGIREDARSLGIDKVERDVFAAAANRDIVVIALPYADVQTAYKNLGNEIRSGAVVLDISPLKQPSLEWAKGYLPKDAHMVGVTPILNPKYLFDGLDDTLHAQADLFDKGSMLLMPSVTCIKEAVELASDLSTLLGAAPHFVDPAEHDSLVAVTEGLPGIVGLAAFYMMMKSQNWSDSQRLTNPSFGRLTHHLYDTHPDDLRDAWLNNSDNLVRQLDDLIGTLQTFRGVLAQGDKTALDSALIEASDSYSAWINRRFNAKWNEKEVNAKSPSIGNMLMTGLMGSFLTRRISGDQNGEDKDN
jgi:prephenate dehydrogenase